MKLEFLRSSKKEALEELGKLKERELIEKGNIYKKGADCLEQWIPP